MHRHLADTLMVTLSLHVALTKLPPETFAFLLMALIHGRTRADALRRLTRLQRFATGFKKIAGGGPNGMADFRDF